MGKLLQEQWHPRGHIARANVKPLIFEDGGFRAINP